MKQRQKFSVLRFAATATLALVGFFALALGAVLPSLFGATANAEGETVKLSGVTVTQNDDWIVTDATKNLDADVLIKMFGVEVTYATGETVTDEETGDTATEWTDGAPTVLEFSGTNGKTATATTGEIVTFSFEGKNIKATVTPRSGAIVDPDDPSVTSLDGTYAYKSGTRRENGIYGEYIGTDALTTLSDISKDNIKVAYTYNDGTKQNINDAMGGDSYNVVTPSLFPNRFDASWADGRKYSVEIKVMLNADVSASITNRNATVLIDDITYVKPTEFAELGVPQKAADQTARSKFNYDGFYVYAIYDTGEGISVPLSAFENIEGCLVNEYFNSSAPTVSLGNSLTTKANRVKVKLIDPITGAEITHRTAVNVTVDTISIDTPTFDYYEKEQDTADGRTAVIDFNIGLTIGAALPDYSQYRDNGGEPSVTFSITPKDGVTADDANGSYVFSKPGTYVISAALTGETSADFVWGSPNGGGVRQDGNKVLNYRVQISKGAIKIQTLADIEYVYGSTPTLPAEITATEVESGKNIENKFGLGEFNANDDDTSYIYRMEYYGWGEFDENTRSLTAPTEAGKYKAVAVTKVNLYYYSAVSDEIAVTVTPKPIDVADVLLNPTYERGTVYAVTGNAANANTILENVAATYDLTYEITGETEATVIYAKEYAVTLKIGNNNYMWKGATLPDEWTSASELTEQRTKSDATFTINKRTIKYTLSGSTEFYYGDVDLTKISTVASADDIYLGTPTVEYEKDGSAVVAANCNTWDHGDYTVVYTPVGNTAAEAGSLTLVASDPFAFKVKPAEVNVVTFDETHKTYDPAGHEFVFNGWVSLARGGLGSVSDIQSLLARTVTGKRHDGTTAIDLSALLYYGDNNEKVKLTEAGKYTVTVSLPTSGNFVWVGGGTSNLTATWIINKATVDKPTVPESVDYNGADRSITLDYDGTWNDSILNVYKVNGVAATSVGGAFTVHDAGDYTVSVKLADPNNYMWADAANETAYADLEIIYNVKKLKVSYLYQAVGATEWQNVKIGSAYYDGASDGLPQTLPEFKFVSAHDGELKFAYTINGVGGTVSSITEVGTYTFEFALDASVINYEIDAGYETFAYTIAEQKLVKITLEKPDDDSVTSVVGSAVNAIYKGAEYVFADFVALGEGKTFESVYGARVTVEISGAGSVIRNAGSYTVKVTPNGSYTWEDGTKDPQTFTFDIDRRTVTVTWNKTTDSYYGHFVAPEAVIENNFDGNDLTVAAGFRSASGGADIGALGDSSEAEHYYVYVKALDGSAAGNYELAECETDFYIYKQVLTLPTELENVDKTYNGVEQSVIYAGITADAWNYLDGKITATVTGENEMLKGVTVSGGAFDVKTGTFKFTDAGVYTVVFEVADKNNYCLSAADKADFDESNGTYSDTRTDFITVNRKTVTAPDLTKTYRDQEWASAEDFSELLSGFTTEPFSVTYYDTNGNVVDKLAGVSQEESDRGTYSFELFVNGDAMLNYVWQSAAIDKPAYSDKTDELTYTETKVSIRIYYTIVGSKLVVEYEVTDGGYTFGDNGTVDGATKKSGIESLVRLTADSQALIDQTDNVGEITLENIIFKNDGEDVTDFENGLPWNAGSYTVDFDVKFGDGMVYQTLPVKGLKFTVKPRVIDVVWSNLSKVYDNDGTLGTTYAVATMQNVPARSSGAISAPDLTVTASKDGKPAIALNVGTYTVAVTGLSGANADNFTVDGSATATFDITKFEVSLKADEVTGAIYGDSLPTGWSYVDGNVTFFDDGASGLVRVVVVDADGKEVTKPLAGVKYYLDLKWSDDTAIVIGNYEVDFNNGAVEYTVAQREITVTLGEVKTAYYDEVNTYKDGDGNYLAKFYTVAADAFVYGDIPFTLGSTVDRDSAAGSHDITVSANGACYANYAITFVWNDVNYTLDELNAAKVYKHVIDKAELTAEVKAIDGFTYDAKNHALVASKTPNGQNLANNDLQWFIAIVDADTATADGANWVAYDGAKHFARDAEMYYFFIKATADNHTDFVSGKFAVAVTPAKLTATVTGYTATYNASDHGYLDGSSISGIDLQNNAPTWYIVTVDKNDVETATAPDADDTEWTPYDKATHCAHDAGKYYFYVMVTANNHETVILSDNGKPFAITVEKAIVTVKMNLSVFYGEENPASMNYMSELADLTALANKSIFVIADGDFKSVADKNAFYGGTLASGTFLYSVDSYTQGSGVTVGGVEYIITFDGSALTSTNYKFAGEDGELIVKPLPVTVVIGDYTAKFDQDAPPAPEADPANITTTQKSTYGDGIIDIWKKNEVVTSITTAALTPYADGYTTNAVKYDAEKNIIGYDINIETSGNYAVSYTPAKYKIERADNKIVGEYSLFKDANSWKQGDAAADTTTAAWVYGKKSDANTDGYDASGKHELKNLELLCADKETVITIKRGEKVLATKTVAADGDATAALREAFADIYAASGDGTFYAGSYTVTVATGVADNYEAFTETWCFAVEKKVITITPQNISLDYGEDIPAPEAGALHTNKYVYTHDALTGYGVTDKLGDIVTFTFGSVFDLTSAALRRVGSYEITATVSGETTVFDDKTVFTSDNYMIRFDTATLTVSQRDITITINSATNRYMFLGDYVKEGLDGKYESEAPAALDYAFAENSKYKSFYGDEIPFGLATDALKNHNAQNVPTATADYGKYAIYAKYATDEFKHNYNITVADSSTDDVAKPADKGALVITSGYGVFSVEKAQLRMAMTGPYYEDESGSAVEGAPADKKFVKYASEAEGLVYDGRAKHYFATPNLGNRKDDITDVPSFEPAYYVWDGTTWVGADAAPVDQGTYMVEFRAVGANENFEALELENAGFTVAAKQLTVSATVTGGTVNDDGSVTYSGGEYTVTYTFAGVVDNEVLSLVTAVDGKNFDKADIPSTVTAPGKNGNANNVLTVKAVKAGTYDVRVNLDNVVVAMKNYTLAGTGVQSGTYTYTLTVNKARLYIWIQDATVQYGTQIFNDNGTLIDFTELDAAERERFSGFKVAYTTQAYGDKPASTPSELQNIISKNITEKDLITSQNGVMYTAANYRDGRGGSPSAVGATASINVPYFEANNFTVDDISLGTLTVVKRKIQIETSGANENNAYASSVYDGTTGYENKLNNALRQNANSELNAFFAPSNNAFGVSGDDLESLGLSVEILGDVKNCGSYGMQPHWSDGNYQVEFTYNDTTIGGANYPAYKIEQKDLYVKVHRKDDIAYGDDFADKKATVDVTYGEVLDGYKVLFYGWVAGEGTADGSNLLGGTNYVGADKYDTAYVPFDSHVGEKITVSPKNILDNLSSLGNYEITYLPADIKIAPRPITVKAPDREFIPETANNYGNYGAYGKACPAEVVFDGVDQDRMDGLFMLLYDNKADLPTVAKTYTVTVTVNENSVGGGNYDYVFESGNNVTTTPYTVTKKLITDFDWSRRTIEYDDADKTNTISKFVASIMVVKEFNDGSSSIVLDNSALTDTGLTYTATGVGKHVITIELRNSAEANFKWNEDDSQISAIKEFIVTTSGRVEIIDLSMNGWVYGDAAVDPDAKLRVIGTTVVVNGTITYWYANVTAGGDDVTLGGKELLRSEAEAYAHTAFALKVPVDAGVYLMRAQFDGNAEYPAADSKYYIFRVEKKSFDKPEPQIASDTYGENDKGVGSITSSAIPFDPAIMQVLRADVHYTVDASGLTLDTANANASGYSVEIKLTDTKNCEWSDGTVGNVIVKWVVSVASDNTVEWATGSASYSHEYGAAAAEFDITTKYNYNRVVNYWYVSAEGVEEGDLASLEPNRWMGGTPFGAGDYWIHAVVRSADGNYAEAYGYHRYTVTKANLDVTAEGSMIYGDDFAASRREFAFDIAELKYETDNAAVRLQIERSITYSIDCAVALVPVDSYALTFTATADNYNITCVGGTFTVEKRRLDVAINPATSVYGDELVALTARVSGFAPDESAATVETIKSSLNAALVKADGTYADVYDVTLPSSFVLDNYSLDVTNGKYTITRLPVKLTVDNGGGVFDFNGNGVVLPSVTSAVAGGKDWIDEVKAFVEIRYDGIAASDDPRRADAGSYTFSVALGDCNFAIAGQAIGTFTITRRTLDAATIEWNDVFYNGAENNHPTIKNNPFGEVFDIEYVGEWKDAGVPYVIKLKLLNTNNTMWAAATDATGVYRELTYTIKRGKNSLVATEGGEEPTINISGWTYGGYTDADAPTAEVLFGDAIRYEYSTTENFAAGTVLDGVPVDAGTYYVRVVVEGSDNWERFESSPVRFEVSPLMQTLPEIGIYAETSGGHYKNDTYTGTELGFDVFGFDSTLMEIDYDGYMVRRGDSITLLAVNAGTYAATITLKNGQNYNWASVTVGGKNADKAEKAGAYSVMTDGNKLVITWTIAKKKVSKPTANDNTYMVNGSELVYTPVGFDPDVMSITGNVSSYGGDFKAYVSLIDPDNYEWADGSLGAVVIEWHVVGADTLFAILVSILVVLAVGAGAFAWIELYRYLKKKKSGKSGGGSGNASARGTAAESTAAETAANAESGAEAENTKNAANAENAKSEEKTKNDKEGTVTA